MFFFASPKKNQKKSPVVSAVGPLLGRYAEGGFEKMRTKFFRRAKVAHNTYVPKAFGMEEKVADLILVVYIKIVKPPDKLVALALDKGQFFNPFPRQQLVSLQTCFFCTGYIRRQVVDK